jgi:hypothetical protein
VAQAAPNTMTTTAPPADAMPAPEPAAPPEKAIRMELKKNYKPRKLIGVVGWNRPEKRVKDAAGNERIIQTAGFVEGEQCPAPMPGVGYPGKIWAGTVIEVPESEAKAMRDKKIAEAWI